MALNLNAFFLLRILLLGKTGVGKVKRKIMKNNEKKSLSYFMRTTSHKDHLEVVDFYLVLLGCVLP